MLNEMEGRITLVEKVEEQERNKRRRSSEIFWNENEGI